VFDKFYQVSATTKGVRGGTGLGLALTKSLVEEHCGRIWVKSDVGPGGQSGRVCNSRWPSRRPDARRLFPHAWPQLER
jgi:light-regulated signal transduction histidine kinase (bacteriophytochrome)